MKIPVEFLTQKLGISREEYDAIQAGDPSPIVGRFSDPLLAAMLSSMIRRNASAPREHEEDSRHRELFRARMIVRRLKMEIATTRAVMQRVARIAGACPRCLGLNTVCSQCQGVGHPGSREPEQDEFLAWIAPALASLNLEGAGTIPTASPESADFHGNQKEKV